MNVVIYNHYFDMKSFPSKVNSQQNKIAEESNLWFDPETVLVQHTNRSQTHGSLVIHKFNSSPSKFMRKESFDSNLMAGMPQSDGFTSK